jgi:hypothetical protein
MLHKHTTPGRLRSPFLSVKQPRQTDSTLVKALARAFRWKRLLESGEFAPIAELAEREGIAPPT